MEGVDRLVARIAELEAELGTFRRARVGGLADELVGSAERVGKVSIVAEVVQVPDADGLMSLLDTVRDRLAPSAVALATELGGKGTLAIGVSSDMRGLHAGDVTKAVAVSLGGGGGGNANLGRAGGIDPARLGDVVAKARQTLMDWAVAK